MKILGQYDPEADKARKDKRFFTFVPPDLMKEVNKPKVFSETELQLSDDLLKSITDIKEQDPDFLLDRFLSGANKAFSLLHKALLAHNKAEIDFLLDNDLVKPAGKKIMKINKADLQDIALYGDRAVITILFSASLEEGGLYQAKLSFSRYLSQVGHWKITKYQKLDVKKLEGPDLS